MKIIHVGSTDITGGAGRAAYRLHRAIIAAGQESFMLVASKQSDDSTVFEVPQAVDFATHLGKLAWRFYIDQHRTAHWNTYFSLAWPAVDLAEHDLIKKADIIHLHWLWDYQSLITLGRLMKLGKPVVWTFHDQRAMTGGCHYSASCNGYEMGCSSCPQLSADPMGLTAAMLSDQKQVWRRDVVTVIALSQWMADCARKSEIWRNSRIEVIPNSVETEVFIPLSKEECRRKLALPENACCVLFGADFGNEIRKGFHYLMRALKQCLNDPWFADELRQGRIKLVCFGNPDAEVVMSSLPIHSLGYLKEDAELAVAYGAADFFVLPSLEDNLPNTVLESMSCGRPVLAFDAGGARDMVIEGTTGWLVPSGDQDQLAAHLLKIVRNPFLASEMAAACREHILINFSQDLQAHRFYELYKNLLSDSIVSNTKEGCSPYGMLSPRLDFGPQTRLIFPKLVRSVIPSLELESINDCSAESRFLKFYRALESKLACQLSYEVFLKTLEDAWNESPKPISTENTLPSKESHPLSFFIKFFMKRFQ